MKLHSDGHCHNSLGQIGLAIIRHTKYGRHPFTRMLGTTYLVRFVTIWLCNLFVQLCCCDVRSHMHTHNTHVHTHTYTHTCTHTHIHMYTHMYTFSTFSSLSDSPVYSYGHARRGHVFLRILSRISNDW